MSAALKDTDVGSVIGVFVDDLIFEECVEMMWNIRTNSFPPHELQGMESLGFEKEKKGSNASVVSCPVCAENVSGLRFAPHLEKCLNGGKRGSKRHYDCLQDEGMGKSLKKVHKNMDPFPNSLIVRFKMKGGVPKGNKWRVGARSEDFASGIISQGVSAALTAPAPPLKLAPAQAKKVKTPEHAHVHATCTTRAKGVCS
ncbi:hypothetical protein B484DRAFT_448327 [Ochromonadaceae sp. CCMP2298]|nr:hypothetical protein B484DRAFT_448327 [Ochromonadaceae sp. CCMP2298]|mmetsp:Transcript_33584/g.74017  ORF Transcript_33584/g.74017 Transcript_33584/m.74017 type:complete len:199 (+) Transcript_33584:294-890(+)